MGEENLMCPICGGLHPAGHRDKELEDKLEAVKNWLTYAKAQGYISISKGEQLDEILGADS